MAKGKGKKSTKAATVAKGKKSAKGATAKGKTKKKAGGAKKAAAPAAPAWTEAQLSAELAGFEAALTAAGLSRATVQGYVGHATGFVRHLGGGSPLARPPRAG